MIRSKTVFSTADSRYTWPPKAEHAEVLSQDLLDGVYPSFQHIMYDPEMGVAMATLTRHGTEDDLLEDVRRLLADKRELCGYAVVYNEKLLQAPLKRLIQLGPCGCEGYRNQ